MIILSDCLRDTVDEGCLKVANSIAKRMKQNSCDTLIVSYKHRSSLTDLFFKLNPLFLNRKLWQLFRKRKDTVLYIPFASNTFMSSLRLLVLSLFNHGNVKVIFALRHPMNPIARFFLSISRAQIYALSKESQEYYGRISKKEVIQLKAGCETAKFLPVSDIKKLELREKYKINPNETVVLHAGHLNKGRNIGQLLKLDRRFHVILLLSTTTFGNSDSELLAEIQKRPNTTVIRQYVPAVEEIFQLSDVYFFPVVEAERCIDLPLSVLEAASCNIPIVCTRYGALAEFSERDGLFFLDGFDSKEMNDMMLRASLCKKCSVRELALRYDWSRAVETIADESGACT